MEITEELVRARWQWTDGNVDGVMRQHDDFELQIVAFELFRMISVIGNADREGLFLSDLDGAGLEGMLLDGERKDGLCGCQGGHSQRNGEEDGRQADNQAKSLTFHL